MDKGLRAAAARLLSGLTVGVSAVAFAARAVAHEDEGMSPQVAEAVAPGMTAFGALILAVLVVAVWYYLRRASILRAIRRQSAASEAPGAPQSEDR